MIRNKINPSLDNLNYLNHNLSWIPGSENIRPTTENVSKKELWLENINYFYDSEVHYVLSEVFNFKSEFVLGKLHVKKSNISNKHIFKENMFPYELPKNTNHYIIWYSYNQVDEDQINKDINNSLLIMLGNDNFDFVWYENPKKSLPEINHYQVFWINLNL